MKAVTVISIGAIIVLYTLTPTVFADSDNFSLARIQWSDRCYTLSNFGTVKVLEPDNNMDPAKPDSFKIQVWSSHDKDHVLDVMVRETGNSTGIFEGIIPFGQIGDEASANRIPISKGDMLMARYEDKTLPPNILYPQVPVTLGTSIEFIPYEFPTKEHYDEKVFPYDPCIREAFALAKQNNKDLTWLNVVFPSPSKQLQSGIYLHEIQCKQGLVLSFKYDDSPICVKESSIPNLFERGWITIDSKLGLFPTIPLHEGGSTSDPKSVIPWVFMKELLHRGIYFENQQGSYLNTGEGYLENTRVCSPLISPNGTAFYISATFHPEPFEITGVFVDSSEPSDCHKYWTVPYGSFDKSQD